MNDIPCIKNKCITYAVCKQKKEITCPILHQQICKEFDNSTLEFKNMVLKIVSYYLPNLEAIHHGDREFISFSVGGGKFVYPFKSFNGGKLRIRFVESENDPMYKK